MRSQDQQSSRHHLGTTIALAVTLMTLLAATAASAAESCRDSKVTSIPSRPTVANATDVTGCGIVELEYGLERQWPGGGSHRSDFSGGIRLGLTPNLDFHWFAADYISLFDANGTRTGFGDNWFGLKYRFLQQTRHRPSLGVFYSVKAPTGELALGSSGKVDHAFSLLASKDVKPFHFDFNVIPQLIGRPAANGFDRNVGFAWATWLPATRRWTLVGEGYGFTALNDVTPGFASVMGGVTYQVNPRLYLDGGIDIGASHFAPRKRVFGGFTFAAANLYGWLLPRP